ncbi:hypothetical protein ACLOJK_001576 [Asimina triloba]
MAKKTDSSSSTKRKKSMKKLLSASNSIAMKSKNAQKDTVKSNPFESIWSRRKFDILGKKRKGQERHIGLARSQAIEKAGSLSLSLSLSLVDPGLTWCRIKLKPIFRPIV